jgi:hypothetical protein
VQLSADRAAGEPIRPVARLLRRSGQAIARENAHGGHGAGGICKGADRDPEACVVRGKKGGEPEMTDAEKKRKGLSLADTFLEEAQIFGQEFQHREMEREYRNKALGVLAALRHMGLISSAEWKNRVYMAERRKAG